MARLTGFSLSRCVNDIAAGRVAYEDVEKIVARTAWASENAIKEGIASYKATAWADNPEQAAVIARRLFDEGKVEQPRLKGQETPSLPGGNFHWMDGETKQIITSPEITHAAAVLEADRSWAALGAERKPGEKGSPHGVNIINLG